jgi:hypothetical protein
MKVVCAFIAFISGVPKNRYRALTAGDDVETFVADQYLHQFIEGIKAVYTDVNEKKIHGLGLIAKFIDVHKYKVNMLSKTGVSNEGLWTYAHR